MKSFLLFLLLCSMQVVAAEVDLAPSVDPVQRNETGLFLIPKVKPASRKAPRDSKKIPTVNSPRLHEANFQAPAVAAPDKLEPVDLTPRLGLPESACSVKYADILRANRMGRAGRLTAIGLTTAGAAALAAKLGYDQIPNPEDRDSSRFRVKSRDQIVAEAQSYLKNEFSPGRRLIGDYLNKDFSFGQWLLAGEFAQNGGDPADFAMAGAIYSDLVKKAKEVNESKLPFLEKVQAIRRLALENPGILSGYCSGLTTLNEALLNHCGNCEASMKTYISLLHDAEVAFEPPYELGIQVFSDHIQPVLRNKQTNEVTDLDSGNTVTELKESIYRPELLLWGYLKGQKVDTVVDRQKDLMIAELPVDAEINAQNFNIETDTFFNFGGGRSASSSRPPPAYARRTMGDGELGKVSGRSGDQRERFAAGSGSGAGGGASDTAACYGKALVETKQNFLSLRSDPDIFSDGVGVGFRDFLKRRRWDEATPMERWTITKKMIKDELEAQFARPEVKNAMVAWEKGDPLATDLPKDLYSLEWSLNSLKMLGNRLQNCIDPKAFPISPEKVSRELTLNPVSSRIERVSHLRGAEIADNPLGEILRLKKLKHEQILRIGLWNSFFSGIVRSLDSDEKKHRPVNLMGGASYFRTEAGNLYDRGDPYAAMYETLADRKRVEVADSGSKKKTLFAEDGIEVPSIPLTEGDYGGIVVLPKSAKEKTAAITLPPETMLAILNVETQLLQRVVYGMNVDYLNVRTRIADRLTDEVMAAVSSLKPEDNIVFLQHPLEQVEALKAIPAFAQELGPPSTLWRVTVYPQIYKGTENGLSVYEKSEVPVYFVYKESSPQLEGRDIKEKLTFDGSVSEVGVSSFGSFSLKLSGRPIFGSIAGVAGPHGTIGISFGSLAWACDKTCRGRPNFKSVINDPKLRELKRQLEQTIDPSILRRLKEMDAF